MKTIEDKYPEIFLQHFLMMFNADLNEENLIDSTSIDWHAVTINGFSLESLEKGNFGINEVEVKISNEIALYSSRMSRFFCHDDQLCPFAKVLFSEKFYSTEINDSQSSSEVLDTYWQTNNSENLKKGKVKGLLIPVYHKIRVDYDDIYMIVYDISVINRNFYQKIFSKPIKCEEWEIFLIKSNTYINMLSKKEFTHDDSFELDENYKQKKILNSYPRYIWIARLKDEINEEVMDLIFDTTESKNGENVFLDSVIYKINPFMASSNLIDNKVVESFGFNDRRKSNTINIFKNLDVSIKIKSTHEHTGQ